MGAPFAWARLSVLDGRLTSACVHGSERRSKEGFACHCRHLGYENVRGYRVLCQRYQGRQIRYNIFLGFPKNVE